MGVEREHGTAKRNTLDPPPLLSLRRIEASLPPSRRPRFHFFSSFFYKKLIQGSGRASAAAGPSSSSAPRPPAANHAAVASWTRGVDIFAADYILIPVHDDLHWSLIIVAYPGAVAGTPHTTGDATAATAVAAVYQLSPPPPTPSILHLDSMGNHSACGHKAGAVARVVRSYLEHEWAARAAGDASSVAARAVAARGALVDWRPAFQPKALPTLVPTPLPLQDNAVDCGLLVLAYADHFCAGAPLPPRVGDRARSASPSTTSSSPTSPDALNPSQLPLISRQTLSELWRVPRSPWPGFLHETWFPPGAEAGGLRRDLRAFMLAEMVAQMPSTAGSEGAIAHAAADAADAAGGPPAVHYTHPSAGVDRARARVAAALERAAARGTGVRGTRRRADDAGAPPAPARGHAHRSTLAAAAAERRARGGGGGGALGATASR